LLSLQLLYLMQLLLSLKLLLKLLLLLLQKQEEVLRLCQL
jgi:hypothetical protein